MAVSMKLGEAMYKASQEAGEDASGVDNTSSETGQQQAEPSDETIVDAEFEEVDLDNKEDEKKGS
jgi:molecular chaperone DnaK